ncbi:MAG: hypothetical protein PHE43_03980 [Candidatus Nanoarchaeia archaeon]|nr:hypothetical protein [Candidatus Nanoarchaeia archaeon]
MKNLLEKLVASALVAGFSVSPMLADSKKDKIIFVNQYGTISSFDQDKLEWTGKNIGGRDPNWSKSNSLCYIGLDGYLGILDTESNIDISLFGITPSVGVKNPKFSPDGKKILYEIGDNQLGLFNADNKQNKINKILPTSILDFGPKNADWIDSSSFIYKKNGNISIYNILNDTEKEIFKDVSVIKLSPDKTKVAYGSLTGKVLKEGGIILQKDYNKKLGEVTYGICDLNGKNRKNMLNIEVSISKNNFTAGSIIAWSPNSKKVLFELSDTFTSQTHFKSSFFIYDTKTNKISPVAQNNPKYGIADVDWIDNSNIAFSQMELSSRKRFISVLDTKGNYKYSFDGHSLDVKHKE